MHPLRLTSMAALATLTAACGAPLSPRDPRGTPHFSVATFNVYSPAWNDPPTVEVVAEVDADVVFLQEVNEDWKRILVGRYASRYPNRLFEPRSGAGGMAVLSRFPVRNREIIAPTTPGSHFAWIVDVATPIGPIQVLAVHLRSPLRGAGSALENYGNLGRDHEMQLRSFMARLSGGPTLVVGDFNEGPSGRAISWLARHGFRNGLPAFHPGQPTWRGRSVAGQFEMSIDHITFDVGFEPLDVSVVNAGNSDHLPVVAVLSQTPRRDHR